MGFGLGAVALAAGIMVLPHLAAAQTGHDDAPPARMDGVADQRVENVAMRLQQAAERLTEVAPDGDETTIAEAKRQAVETLWEVRRALRDLPQARYQEYEPLFDRAEQAVQGEDLTTAAAALARLRETLTPGRSAVEQEPGH